MDLLCTCCGKPWGVSHVLYEAPQSFNRSGALISACPCCKGQRPKQLRRDVAEELEDIKALAVSVGDDINLFAILLDCLSHNGAITLGARRS